MASRITTAVFDLGGVLVDWNPRHLYRKLMHGDEEAVERFLSEICTQNWNEEQDAGRSFAEAEAILKAKYPDKAELIGAWFLGFNTMLDGPIKGTVDLLSELRERNVPLYALTNWSAETFPTAQKRFEFLSWFKGIVVSGVEKVIKPDARIYKILLERYRLDPVECIYIDDNPVNVEAATKLGFTAFHFTNPEVLKKDIQQTGLL